MELGLFQWCPVPRQEATDTNKHRRLSLSIRKHIWKNIIRMIKYCHRLPRLIVEFPIVGKTKSCGYGCREPALQVTLCEQKEQTKRPPKVPSNLSHSVIPREQRLNLSIKRGSSGEGNTEQISTNHRDRCNCLKFQALLKAHFLLNLFCLTLQQGVPLEQQAMQSACRMLPQLIVVLAFPVRYKLLAYMDNHITYRVKLLS